MEQKRSLSEGIYNDLKQKILLNHLRPGEMIAEVKLTQQYHVSRTPIRQALKKLEDRGLVHILDGVGTFVTYISADDMRNAYEIRNAIERIAIRTSINHITAEELNRLEEKFLKLQQQLTRGGYGASIDEIAEADWLLHDLIVERSENAFLPQMTERINLVMRRYQYSYVSTFEKALQEHLEIIRLIRAKDLSALDRALDAHLHFKPI